MSRTPEPLSLMLLGRLTKALEFSPPPVRLVGMHSSVSLGLYLSQANSGRLGRNPHCVVTADEETAAQLIAAIRFFNPHLQTSLLPPFDVSVYSNLYPNQAVIAQRLKWLFNARRALPGQIFVAPVQALLQKTLPYSAFTKNSATWSKNSELPSPLPTFLQSLGYVPAPTVEDIGTFSIRGGILDIFSPAGDAPYRLELFGDIVDSIRTFNPETQLTIREEPTAHILPAREALYSDENRQHISQSLQRDAHGRPIEREELQDILRSVAQGQPFYGMDFLLPYFYSQLDSALDYFSQPVDFWIYNRLDVLHTADELQRELKVGYEQAEKQTLRVPYQALYLNFDELRPPEESQTVWADKVSVVDAADFSHGHPTLAPSDADGGETANAAIEMKSMSLADFSSGAQASTKDPAAHALYISEKISRWRAQGYRVVCSTPNRNTAQRLQVLFDRAELAVQIVDDTDVDWNHIVSEQAHSLALVHIVLRELPEGLRLPEENLIFLTDQDLLGKRRVHSPTRNDASAFEQSEALSFGELQPGDFVVHRLHGVGVYDGLKAMSIEGAPSEFIELRYKDGDRLYLPVYRIGQLHKYSGPASLQVIDKLGGTSWAKTKTKVSSQLRDVADRLLRLYAKRAQMTRPPFSVPDDEFSKFENTFPYQETDDQLRAIHDVLKDMTSERPMDRLVCGDVGFGKTEVALRAAFKAAQDGRQVALVAPTTILTYQHYQNFARRFANWPFVVRALNRFVPPKEVKQTLMDLRAGKVDIVIGTHRLLSKDVEFKDLGILILDEEQKFGVVHKERLRHMRVGVDTLAMSATPIPRTLNMSLVGIRDLSIINTPPEDRLPTRTFVCKHDDETLRKAIQSEIQRGGQVFFLHNRVQTIEEAAAKLRDIVPEARMAIAHGQMDESQLEATMLKFFKHELDILVCTAIIESGMDIPRANTIFIDNAHTFGVSQLYQLRGRVGRSKERAYCYLILPADRRIDATAQERLKIIQENTALGSGLRVAQYDLELRGAGDILGEDQSGHINAVGYELYMELLNEVLAEQKGEPHINQEVEPEINLRVPALLPDKYVPDIRTRLYYYKSLSNVRSIEDIDRIEQELRDQFGPPPDPVMNLLGLMLIRKYSRDLGVKDISAGKNVLSLAFTEKTPLPPQEVVRLTTRENKKYALAPDQRLKIRMNEIAWPRVVEELEYLIGLCPKN